MGKQVVARTQRRTLNSPLEDLVTNVMDLSDSEKRKHADTKPSCEQKAFHPLRLFWRVTWGNTKNILKSWVDFPGAQLLPFFELICPEPYCVRWICWQSQRRLLSWAEWLWTRRSRNDKTTNPYQLPIHTPRLNFWTGCNCLEPLAPARCRVQANKPLIKPGSLFVVVFFRHGW